MQAEFRKHLRNALNHLYDQDYLSQSPLTVDFGVSERAEAGCALQRVLMDAIEDLKPRMYESSTAEKRKNYDILLYRYIQHFSQDELAHHLGVSERQFRREQEAALGALAYYLEEKYRLSGKRFIPPGSAVDLYKVDVTEAVQQEKPPVDEYLWVRNAHFERVSNAKAFVEEIVQLMQPVAGQFGVKLEFQSENPSRDIAVHPVAFRQILLNLIRIAINDATGGSVFLKMVYSVSSLEINIRSLPRSGQCRKPLERSLLEIATHLAQISGGTLTVNGHSGQQTGGTTSFIASLGLPVVDGVAVLAIDDNPEILQLLKRYTDGSRYQVIGLSQPEQVFELVSRSTIRIIVLDVMMPKIDGWELLGRLRRHPQTEHIPVIILTILAQEELALALGAKALVLKPVTQERFLAVLDEILAAQNLNSH